MSTLLISATSKEIEPLLSHSSCKQLSSTDYQLADLFIKITGIGLLETTYQLSTVLNDQINFVIQVGVAGSYQSDLALGEVVEVASEQYGDLGAESDSDFLTIDQIGLRIPLLFNNGVITNSPKYNELKPVKSISVNSVAGNQKTITIRKRLFNPDIENMEGLALFRVCKEKNIEFAQVRSISNIVEPRNRENWKMDLAIQNLNNFILNEIVH